jgi:hypothetical protein
MATKEYPSEICCDCGNKYGKARHSYGFWQHEGTCGWCGEERGVVNPRNYGSPKFPLKE